MKYKTCLQINIKIDNNIIYLFIDKIKSRKYLPLQFCSLCFQSKCMPYRMADTLIFYPISHLFRIHSNNIANSSQFLFFPELTQSVTNDLLFCLSIFSFPYPFCYNTMYLKLPKTINSIKKNFFAIQLLFSFVVKQTKKLNILLFFQVCHFN